MNAVALFSIFCTSLYYVSFCLGCKIDFCHFKAFFDVDDY